MGFCCRSRVASERTLSVYSVEIEADVAPKTFYSQVSSAIGDVWSRVSWSSLKNAYRIGKNRGLDEALTLARPADAPFFDFHTPAGTQYVVCDPEITRALLGHVRKSSEGFFDDHENRAIFVENILTHLFPDDIAREGLERAADLLVISASEASHIKALRAPYLSTLSKGVIDGYKIQIATIASQLLDRISPSHSCNAAQLAFEFAVQVICKTIIGYDVSHPEEYAIIAASLDSISKHMSRVLLHIPANTVEQAQFDFAIGEMRRVIELHMTTPVKLVRDLRSQGLVDFQIKCHLFFLYFAASETTAASLNHFLWILGKTENKDFQERLRKEIQGLTREEGGISLMQQAVRENLRLHPSAFVIGRTPSTDLRLSIKDAAGLTIATKVFLAGHNILFHIKAIARNSDLYPDPARFDPSRFKSSLAMPWSPFGSGPHVCPGQFLAYAELESLITAILQRFSLRTIGPIASIKQEGIFTLRATDAHISLEALPSTATSV